MPTEKLLAVRRNLGSTDHYYHFLLGVMVPLLLRNDLLADPTIYILRSCGPLDEHVRALSLANIRIMPWLEWRAIFASRSMGVEVLHAVDDPQYFDAEQFRRARAIVQSRLALRPPVPDDAVLFVNRGKSPDYYQSDATDHKQSANLRRSVPNMPALAAAAQALGFAARLVELETASFAEQVALFGRARVVVAQHGAALANMLWMSPGGTILEINPLPATVRFHSLFAKLSSACAQNYICIPQPGAHSIVPTDRLLASLAPLRNGPSAISR